MNCVNKNLSEDRYNYQDFNGIVREVKNVINEHDLDIDFVQCPTTKSIDGNLVDVVITTFYSPLSGYEHSFDTSTHIKRIEVSWGQKLKYMAAACGVYNNLFQTLCLSCIFINRK
ncbi:ERF family protein (plasmid) [Borrelia recurrentis]|uniref:ERF family protein n=1 Tax=Borrelia recurrentis TaxID=44449 RepID=UPI001E2CA6DC|nr:ERF family protein [Borrelia recurrentis]